MGTINADLNLKIPMLDQLQKETGKINCIFLGSSMTNDSIDPEAFTTEYYRLSGQKITCFNIGIANLTGEIAGEFGKIVIQRYHPDLLIYGTSARDYSEVMGMSGLSGDDWIHFQLGEWNLAGWLKEYSYMYRHYLQFLSNLNPENRLYAISIRQQTSRYGHFIVEGNGINREVENTINEPQLSESDFTGLRRLIKNQDENTRIIVFEAPIHTDYLPIYVNDRTDDYYRLFFEPVQETLFRKDVPFITTITGNKFIESEDGWADMKHLNTKGAGEFSKWIATQVYELEVSGKINRIEWREQ